MRSEVFFSIDVWLTFSARLAAAYLVVLSISRFIAIDRLRFRLWSAFLSVAALSWLGSMFLPVGEGGVQGLHALPGSPTLTWSWQIQSDWFQQLNLSAVWASGSYLIILSLLLIQWAWQFFALHRLVRDAQDAPERIQQVFRKLCSELAVPSCSLQVTHGLRSPATARWWRPRILLPAEIIGRVNTSELADMLRHELVHVRRRDYLWDRLGSLACRIVWFHPAVWLVYRHLRADREFACDYAVAGIKEERRLEYADCLMSLARWWSLNDRSVCGAIDLLPSTSFLATRVRILLGEPSRDSMVRKVFSGLLVLLSVFFLISLLPRLEIALVSSAKIVSRVPAPGEFSRRRIRPPVLRQSSHEARSQATTMSRLGTSAQSLHNSMSDLTLGSVLENPSAQVLPKLKAKSPLAESSTSDVADVSDSGDRTIETQRGAWDESQPGSTKSSVYDLQAVVRAAEVAVGAIAGDGGDSADAEGKH